MAQTGRVRAKGGPIRWNEKLQALKVLKQATQFLKEHGELTQLAKQKFCALALGLVLEGSDRETDEDWDDLLTAADGSEVEVVLGGLL
jgi:hypothetical protein